MHKNKKQKRERGAIIVEELFSNYIYFCNVYIYAYLPSVIE